MSAHTHATQAVGQGIPRAANGERLIAAIHGLVAHTLSYLDSPSHVLWGAGLVVVKEEMHASGVGGGVGWGRGETGCRVQVLLRLGVLAIIARYPSQSTTLPARH